MLSREINRCRQRLKLQEKLKREFQAKNAELKSLKDSSKLQLQKLKAELEDRNSKLRMVREYQIRKANKRNRGFFNWGF